MKKLALSLMVVSLLAAVVPSSASGASLDSSFGPTRNLWIDRATLQSLPTSGSAWNRLAEDAKSSWGSANISDQDSDHDVLTFAGALYAVRKNDTGMRDRVVSAVEDAIGTERGGRTLALGRNLTGYVLAADLVGYDSSEFRNWLRSVRTENLDGRTLINTHEERANNWGTHAGAARIATDLFLGDTDDLDRAVKVFRGFLGDRGAYKGFNFGDADWQANPSAPVPINPAGATRNGINVDGAIVDDIRRCGCSVQSPAPKENYQWEAMQGIVTQATLLNAAGYTDVWDWSDAAILRATKFLYEQANFPAESDDSFVVFLIDAHLGTNYAGGEKANMGKSMAYTDYTHPNGSAAGTRSRFIVGPTPPGPSPKQLRIPVIGVGGVPNSGVDAVSLNLTAVNTTGPGFARIWPCDSDEPSTSSLNFLTGEVVANSMVVPVDDSGEVCVSTSTGADIIVDLIGWLENTTRTTNRRLIDTRETGDSASTSTLRVELDGVSSRATAVSLTLTAVNTTGPGFLEVWPCGSSKPDTSAVNFLTGQVVANSIVVPVDDTGEVCVRSSVRADVIVDTLGWFDDDVDIEADRLVDTRITGNGSVTDVLRVPLGSVPSGVKGVSLTLTAANTTAPGFLKIWPCGSDEPGTSAVNYFAGQFRANSMVLPIDDTESVCVKSSAAADVIVDTLGWVDWDVEAAAKRLIDTRSS